MQPTTPFKKESLVGIDIGSSSIKVVELAEREGTLSLVRTGFVEVQDEDRTTALREALKEVPLKKSKIIVTINCPETAVRVITVPSMPKGELKEAIRLEAKRYFPFSIDESVVDFEILGQVSEKGARKLQVAIAASPRKTVDDTLALLKKVGVKPASLVPIPYALHRLEKASRSPASQTVCLVDIGARFTELLIVKGAQPVFSRKILLGGRDFTQAMTGVLVSDRGRTQLEQDQAEALKREIGIPKEDDSGMAGESVSVTQIRSMLMAPLEQLVGEIDRSFDYYREETGGEKIDSLILYGRGAFLNNLSHSLSEGLGIEARLGDPFERLKMKIQRVRQEENFSSFAVALGAALSLGQGVNLLPPEVKEEIKRTFQRAAIQSAVTSLLLLSVFAYVGMKIQLANFQKRIAVAQFELASLRPDLENVSAEGLAGWALAKEPYWEDVFKELSNMIPWDIHLTQMTLAEGKLALRGRITSESKERILSNLIQDLEKGMFREVKLVVAKETEDKLASQFELNMRVDG